MMSLPLRRTLGLVTALLGVLAMIVCGALVVLTTWFHHATITLAASVESVRLAQAAQVDLLLHERSEDPRARRQVAAELGGKLDELPIVVIDPDGDRLVDSVAEAVRAYLSSAQSGDDSAELRTAAHEALDSMVSWTVAEARAAELDARRWDRIGDVIGYGTGLGLSGLTLVLLWWLRHALKPIVALSQTIGRFASGEREARAEERGPLEVREIAERFNEMATSLSSKREQQVAFLAGVAHDLRNPLNALSMSVAILMPDRGPKLEPRVQRTVTVIQRQVARLDRMINDLLEVAKIESGRLAVNLERHDIGRVVEEIVALFQSTTPDRTISLSIIDRALFVQCDEMRMEQVVGNLVSNAIKYSPGGRDVEVSVYRQGEEAVVSVTDHGIGIATQDLERLFDPFRRVGLSKETIPGVGLGLFVVRRIVGAHRGVIDVDSTPGYGSRFRVRLPLDPPSR